MTRPGIVDDPQNTIRALEQKIQANEKTLARLQEEQIFSEKVLSSLPGIFYVYNEEGFLVRWNKAHEVNSGYSAKELSRMTMMDWISEADKKAIQETRDAIFNKGKKCYVEANLLVKDGRSIPHYFTGVRMTIGNRRYLMGVGTDISDLKKTEDLLKKSEEKYRDIVENAVEGIFQSTPEGKMVSANASMARILGFDSPHDVMTSITDLGKYVYVSQSERERLVRLVKKNGSVSGFEVQFYKKDKQIIWVSLHARSVFDTNGRFSLIEGMILDITKQRKQREHLEKSEALLREENLKLKKNMKDRYRFARIIGKSREMQNVYDLIIKASASDANVIIYGESGTGKELVAKEIHNFSGRSKGPFIPVNCGAIPENLMESEFFGHRKGAFTGALNDREGLFDMAKGGALFLDELGEINQSLQVKLLRALDGGGYTPVGGKEIRMPEVRIIAATNKNLAQYVAQGKIREDFYYRIHVIPIHLPPLRERKEDIPLLAEHFLKEITGSADISVLSDDMMNALFHYEWPGNVRELLNVLQRYVTLGAFSLLNENAETLKPDNGPGESFSLAEGQSLECMMEAHERKLLIQALRACGWNREKAASRLGIPIRTFYRKLKNHCLKRQDLPDLA